MLPMPFQEGIQGSIKRVDKRTQPFPASSDLAFQKAMHREAYIRHGMDVAWMALDRAQTPVDTLYNESHPRVEYKKPIKIKAFVNLTPSKQRLLKYGIDEQRDLLVIFSTAILEDMGITDDIRIGDKIVFDGAEYEILTLNRQEYFANTNCPFEIVCSMNRYRQGE